MGNLVCRIEISGGGSTRSVVIEKSSFVLGRGDAADVKIAASGISRTHLAVTIKDGKILVKDLTSANGTRLAGKKLLPNQDTVYKQGDALNLGLADDTIKLTLVEAHTTPEIELPPLPDMKPKVPKVEIRKPEVSLASKVEIPKPLPEPIISEISPKTSSVIAVAKVPLESTVVDPEFRKMSKIKDNLASEEVMEEARAAALKLKIAAEAQAAKIVQEAKEKVLLEMSKASDKAQAMMAEASDFAYKAQRQGEAEVTKMKQAMQEGLDRLNSEFEKRNEELLREARTTATATKTEAQKEADGILSSAYLKATEIKTASEIEIKNYQKEERRKAEQFVAAAQTEADTILQETRAATALLRRNVERENEESKAQALIEANVIRTEAVHEGEAEATRLRTEAQKYAESLSTRTREAVENEKNQILESALEESEKLKAEATKLKTEAHRQAENLLLRTREEVDFEKQQILDSALEESQKLKSEASKIKSEAERLAEFLLEKTRDQIETEKIKILEQANQQGDKYKADASRDAKKETAAILKKAEADRAGLTHDLEKLSQDIANFEKKKADLAVSNKALQKKNLDLQAEVEETKSKLTLEAAALADKKVELNGLVTEAQKVSDNASLAEEAIKGVREERKALLKEIENLKDLDTKLTASFESHLQQAEADKIRLKVAVEDEVAGFKDTAFKEVKLLREKAQSDFALKQKEQSAELERMRITELGTIQGLRAEEETRFALLRQHHILEISKALETYVIPRIKEALNWAEVPKTLDHFFVDVKDIVEKVIEGQFSGVTADTAMDVSKVKPKKSAIKRSAMIIAGAGLAALIFVAMIPMENQGKRKPASEVFLDRLKQKEAQKPKFNPKLTDEFKNTYTDNVIYTKDYSTFKLNPDNQALWIKELNKFFITNLGLNENAIVRFISVESALVGQLRDLRTVIHLENQKEDIRKMTDAEVNSVSEMVTILGSQDKYRSFRQFEKDFFIKSRMPAAVPSPMTAATPAP